MNTIINIYKTCRNTDRNKTADSANRANRHIHPSQRSQKVDKILSTIRNTDWTADTFIHESQKEKRKSHEHHREKIQLWGHPTT